MSIKEVSSSLFIENNTTIAASPSEENIQKKTLGLFYKILDAKGVTRGYLFGTAHMLSMFAFKITLDEKINRRFDKSTSIIVELDIVKDIKLKMDGKVENFNAFIKEQAKKLQSMDLNFLIRAEKKGKPIHELETLELQQQAVKEYEAEYSKNITSRILKRPLFGLTPEEEEFYRDFDRKLDQKDQYTLEGFEEGSEEKMEVVAKFGLSEEVSKRFYAARNEKWAEKIDSLLQRELGLLFIAVGAGHVVGQKGIPTILSQHHHWQVKKM